MWWRPTSGKEADVADKVRSLEKWFYEVSRSDLIFGVGTAFAEGELVPLVLINRARLSPFPGAAGAKESPRESITTRGVDDLKGTVFEQVKVLSLPSETRFIAVIRPIPLAAAGPLSMVSGDPIRCAQSHAKGTAGLLVERTDAHGRSIPGFLTAGHVTPNGTGSAVEAIVKHGLFPTTYPTIGQVSRHNDPISSPNVAGYDFAVVDTDPSVVNVTGPSHNGAGHIAGPLTQPVGVTMYAGSATVANAVVMGALLVVGDPVSRLWKNCWLLLPSGIATQGDSGSGVILNSPFEAVGMVVGGSRMVPSASYLVQYMHDMESLDVDILRPNGIRLK